MFHNVKWEVGSATRSATGSETILTLLHFPLEVGTSATKWNEVQLQLQFAMDARYPRKSFEEGKQKKERLGNLHQFIIPPPTPLPHL